MRGADLYYVEEHSYESGATDDPIERITDARAELMLTP